ncbi:MAG: ABC transporter substrate-binding protein, partial [Thermomicrobiaceae bacterium]|nr:ABC transporter substrate-binding protein [Thermomicrobiaceae bacterium]
MRRWRALGLVAALALVLAACGGGGATPTSAPGATSPAGGAAGSPTASGSPAGSPVAGAPSGEPYKIGAIVAVTGGAADLGVPERNTFQMLQDYVNSQGGIAGPDGKRHPVQVVLYDDQSDESQTVLLANRLIDQDKVPVIIGSTQSGTTLAMADTVTRAQVPLVSLATSAAITHPIEQRHWIFKTPWDDSTVIQSMLEHFKAKGYTKIALLSVNNEYGDSARRAIESLAPTYNIQVVLEDRFGADDTDVTTQLNRVRTSDAQALIFWALPPATAVGVKNYHDLGMKVPLYVSHGVATKAFIDAAGPAAEGIILPAGKIVVADQIPASDPQKQALDQYAQMYTQRFNAPLTTFGGHAWDAFWIVVKAMEKAGPDREKLRDAIEQTKDFAGITGVFTYSPQ